MSHQLLEIPTELYSALIADLAQSGRGVKEAGAFLFGQANGPTRRVSSYLMYDAIAPESSRKHNYVAFTSEEMAAAWDFCYANRLEVVADIHTHPKGPEQSITDKAHPIVSISGHVALIAPYFAMRNPQPCDLGVHVFEGNGLWRSMFHQAARDSILLI